MQPTVAPGSEPRPLPDDEAWVECGGELIWAVGYTPGGVPYGLTAEQMRASAEVDCSDAPWARAKRAIRHTTLAYARDEELEIGWVDAIGAGLSRRAFRADVEVCGSGQTLVALVATPRADSGYATRALREAAALRWLSEKTPGLRVPQIVGVAPDVHAPTLVETFVGGVPLDLRSGRQWKIRPWEVVAEVAAALSTSPVPEPEVVPHRTAVEHRREVQARLAEHADPEPEIVDARAWIDEHVETTREGALLHGDLLGQNIRLDPTGDDSRLGLIDWEYVAIGDPAYDLAIVTRGAKRPFQLVGGLQRLLDAYNRLAVAAVAPADVHLFELDLLIGFYRRDRAAGSSQEHLESRRRAIANLLRRADGSAR